MSRATAIRPIAASAKADWFSAPSSTDGDASPFKQSTRRELTDQLVDEGGHRGARCEVEFVDRHEDADAARRRKRDIGQRALSPAGLLQDERTRTFGIHHDPAEAH